jgi:hypothetical protein
MPDLPGWSCRFDSRRPLRGIYIFNINIRFIVRLTAARHRLLFKWRPNLHSSCSGLIFEPGYAGVRGRLVTWFSTQTTGALKPAMHVQFRRPFRHRSPQRDIKGSRKEFNVQVNKLRAPVERAIAHLKSWRILHTDYRRPLRTYVMSYRAAVGLYFFKLNFE